MGNCLLISPNVNVISSSTACLPLCQTFKFSLFNIITQIQWWLYHSYWSPGLAHLTRHIGLGNIVQLYHGLPWTRYTLRRWRIHWCFVHRWRCRSWRCFQSDCAPFLKDRKIIGMHVMVLLLPCLAFISIAISFALVLGSALIGRTECVHLLYKHCTGLVAVY